MFIFLKLEILRQENYHKESKSFFFFHAIECQSIEKSGKENGKKTERQIIVHLHYHRAPPRAPLHLLHQEHRFERL